MYKENAILSVQPPALGRKPGRLDIPKENYDNKLYDLIKSSYGKNNEAETIGNKYGLKLDPVLSNREHKVFVDPNTNNSSVVFTGTRKPKDLVTDAALLFGLGKYTKRFKDSEKLIKDVRNKYSNGLIQTSGDSLGGTLAGYVKADSKITFNKGTGLGDIGKKIGKNQIDIRTKYDPVSLLSKTQPHANKQINIKSRYLDPHKYKDLHNRKLFY